MSKGRASTLIPVYPAAVAAIGSMIAAAPAQADVGDQGGALLSQINATRVASGCSPVALNPQLTASAARPPTTCCATVCRATSARTGPPLQRVVDAGYTPYAALGEVVFWSRGSGIARPLRSPGG